MFTLDRRTGVLGDANGRRFDSARRDWIAGDPVSGIAIALHAAVRWLQRDSNHPLRVPIGVIGPRDARVEQLEIAEEVGVGLADMGLAVVCGGRQGIMEAVCRGVARHEGIAIGLLPETDAATANPFVTIALATGIGEARNALVARAALCLVAIGDSYGTLSEVALGLQFGKPVFGLAGAARVEGVRHFDTVDAVLDAVAGTVLGL
jgi:uncharacterized protein (TIGR00725 family)